MPAYFTAGSCTAAGISSADHLANRQRIDVPLSDSVKQVIYDTCPTDHEQKSDQYKKHFELLPGKCVHGMAAQDSGVAGSHQ